MLRTRFHPILAATRFIITIFKHHEILEAENLVRNERSLEAADRFLKRGMFDRAVSLADYCRDRQDSFDAGMIYARLSKIPKFKSAFEQKAGLILISSDYILYDSFFMFQS